MQFAVERLARNPAQLASLTEGAWALTLARHLGTPEVSFSCSLDGQPTGQRKARASDDASVTDLAAMLAQQAQRFRAPGATDARGGPSTPLVEEIDTRPREAFARPLRATHVATWTTARRRNAEAAGETDPGAFSAELVLDVVAGELVLDHSDLEVAAGTRTLAVFHHLLRAFLLGREDQSLGGLATLSPAERDRMLTRWNDTETPLFEESIQAAFERQAHQRPDAIAVEADGQAFTFGELDRKANQLAHTLRDRGAHPGTLVGVCMERGANLIVALLGVLKAGAAYVPLDPGYPRDRLAKMVKTAALSLAVTEVHLQHLLGVRSILIDGMIDRVLNDRPTIKPDVAIAPTSPCYVIFTSGSTGEPKGVLLTHRAVVNTLVWVNRRCGVGPGDRALFVTSPSFDLSVYDIFGVLGAGATLVVASASLREDPAKLADVLVRRKISMWNSTPAAFEQILPFVTGFGASPESADPASATALRWVLLSGDWIPLSLPAALRARFPRAGLLALGGATEAAIWSNAYFVDQVDPTWTSIPYGRPIANFRYHVLDERRQPTPMGVSGELYIGGLGLAEGYVHRPTLTAERFVADPFRPGERLYRTGDRARYMESGDIELLGRLDRQVKIRGFRVEMAEVEAALLACTGVRHGVCVTHQDPSGQHVLSAYVVLAPTLTETAESLRRELARTLPPYMVPDHVVVCDRLPLSPQGKIDRQALPRPTSTRTEADHVAPRNAHEEGMHVLWSELLGRERISVRDSFAALGGHSLLAVKLVTEVRARFGVELSISALLAYPSIEALVSHLFGSPEESAGPRARLVSKQRAPHLLGLREEGSRPPLVLVAGVGGFAFTYRNFPAFLGPDQPVYAFQSVGAELGEPLVEHSIEELAAIYEKELEVLPADRPLVLGGFSFGALPAFELACRLGARGRRIPLLVSLDGFAPGYPRPRNVAARVLDHARRLARADDGSRRDYVDARLLKLKERAFRMLGREAALAPDLPFEDEENERLKQLWVFHRRASKRYLPSRRAAGRMLLIRVETPEQWPGTDMSDPLYGWERHVSGPVSLSTIPAIHTELLTSAAHQKAVADVIGRHIDAVIAAERMAEHSRPTMVAADLVAAAFPPPNPHLGA